MILSQEHDMKIISWNVNGVRACAKKGLQDFIKTHKPDVLCLQETKAHIDQVESDIKTLGYEFSQWSSAVRKGYSGVAVFTNLKAEPFVSSIEVSEYVSEGRINALRFKEFDLYNIYFPNGGSGEERHLFKQKFLSELKKCLTSEIKAGRNLIVVGDYNVAHLDIDVYDPIKLSSESGFLPEERKWFDDFLSLGFVDSFRKFHPNEKEKYSWWSYRELARISNRGWRIDYICVTKNLENTLKSADVLDHIEGSDHAPVVAELAF